MSISAAVTLAFEGGAIGLRLGGGTVIVHVDMLGHTFAAAFVVGAVGHRAADGLVAAGGLLGSRHFKTLLSVRFGAGSARFLFGSLPGFLRDM